MRSMMLIVCAMVAFTLAACEKRPSPSSEKSEAPSGPRVVVEREKVDRESPLPPEVKIRLKRDGKDNYSWELSSSDVDQIIKINEKLRKKVGGEQTK
jgi:hypothetical protein